MSIKRVLIDKVCDHSGLVKFATGLIEQGIEIVSRDEDTIKYLKRHKIPVSPTCESVYLDHLLGKDPDYHVDLFVVNIPDIEPIINTLGQDPKQIIDQFDIATISDMRLVAKNFDTIIPIISSSDYDKVLESIESGKFDDIKFRARYAQKVFGFVSDYDSVISQYLFLKSF